MDDCDGLLSVFMFGVFGLFAAVFVMRDGLVRPKVCGFEESPLPCLCRLQFGSLLQFCFSHVLSSAGDEKLAAKIGRAHV